MSKNIIIVFTRNPELGKVKTRLAQTIGNKATLEVYIQLLHHTEHVLNSLNCDVAVYYSETIIQDDIWNKKTYTKYLQNGDNLGERMYNAFKEQFNLHYNKVVIVGSDLFDLKPQHITNAFKALEQNDVVIGPAKDGGYYLLGMTSLIGKVFDNKTWSSDTVLSDTIKDLQNLKVNLLEMLNDIDTFEDLKAHPELLKFINT
jgi:rSAM/selenodomain-associated transferase 1